MQTRSGARSHAQYYREPFLVKSHSPREEACFENSLLCRSLAHSQQFTTHFRDVAADIEFFTPSEAVSQCAENF